AEPPPPSPSAQAGSGSWAKSTHPCCSSTRRPAAFEPFPSETRELPPFAGSLRLATPSGRQSATATARTPSDEREVARGKAERSTSLPCCVSPLLPRALLACAARI